MSLRNWKMRIRDMLESIERIRAYTADMTQSEFERDQRTIDAVLRNLEIIGEAARHIPESVTRRFPTLPWAEMRTMRNIVIHEYFGVNLNIIWHTIQHDLPAVAPQLKEMLKRG